MSVTPAAWRGLHSLGRADVCRCWMCNASARMKLAAWVERAPLTLEQQTTQATFWARFSRG